MRGAIHHRGKPASHANISTKIQKPMRVIVKRPGYVARTLELTGDSLEALQAAVGGYVEVFHDPELPGIDLWINEEGKVQGLEGNLDVEGDVLCGAVVFARTSSAGNTIALRDGDIPKILRWCERRATKDKRFVSQQDVDDYVSNYGSDVLRLEIPPRRS